MTLVFRRLEARIIENCSAQLGREPYRMVQKDGTRAGNDAGVSASRSLKQRELLRAIAAGTGCGREQANRLTQSGFVSEESVRRDTFLAGNPCSRVHFSRAEAYIFLAKHVQRRTFRSCSGVHFWKHAGSRKRLPLAVFCDI